VIKTGVVSRHACPSRRTSYNNQLARFPIGGIMSPKERKLDSHMIKASWLVF